MFKPYIDEIPGDPGLIFIATSARVAGDSLYIMCSRRLYHVPLRNSLHLCVIICVVLYNLPGHI